jgi:hypothetical protein
MGGSSKRHYRPGATKTVTVKATPFQEIAWADIARTMNMPLGPFLSFAGDVAAAGLEAYHRIIEERLREAETERPYGW